MIIFCRKVVIFIFTVLILSNSFAALPRDAYHRNFWQPFYHGERLNYCMLGGKDCGYTVATRYCRIMGYERADQQIIANNVGLTSYLGTRLKCKGWRCNGFKTIRCLGQIKHQPAKAYYYRYQRYVYPRFNNYRVDWCYDGVKGCGYRAALSFCKRMGYLEARGYKPQPCISATKAIGNQKLCFGPKCKAFSQISCYR